MRSQPGLATRLSWDDHREGKAPFVFKVPMKLLELSVTKGLPQDSEIEYCHATKQIYCVKMLPSCDTYYGADGSNFHRSLETGCFVYS